MLFIHEEHGLSVSKACKSLPSRAPVRLEAQTAVNACWSVDFMSDALMHGQRFRTVNVRDDFSREVLAVEVDTVVSRNFRTFRSSRMVWVLALS